MEKDIRVKIVNLLYLLLLIQNALISFVVCQLQIWDHLPLQPSRQELYVDAYGVCTLICALVLFIKCSLNNIICYVMV